MLKLLGTGMRLIAARPMAAIPRRFTSRNKVPSAYPFVKSNMEWREILSPVEFEVLRDKGTEPARSGERSVPLSPRALQVAPSSQKGNAWHDQPIFRPFRAAHAGLYDEYYPDSGHFACAGCNQPLYSAAAKFESGCGWPAFDRIFEHSVVVQSDVSYGMVRNEILCSNCGGHLGHVFEGEQFTSINQRHCVNSVSIAFRPTDVDDKDETKLDLTKN